MLTFDPSSLPVVVFDLQGDLTQAELTRIAETLVVPELSALDGVASVEVVGGAINEVVVTLDRDQMLDLGLAYDQVALALAAHNVILPSGELQTGDTTQPIETVAIYQSIESIQEVPIRLADGAVIPLSQIATVEEIEGQSVGQSRTNGQPSVSVRVTKTKDANTVNVADEVTGALDDAEADLAEVGVTVFIFENQAEFIRESIDGVVEEGLIGGALAIIIVFIFLGNVRSTIVTAVSIPLSIILAIIALDLFGYSLNIMTLAGLTIAIGRVIDDSIVVLENVYRHMAEGEPSFPSIINGAREVTIAIVGATATTCAVFLPLGLVGGINGELFLPFAIAVVMALLGSLLVAVTVIPVLIKFTIADKVKVVPEKKAADTRLGRGYTPILKWALAHRWLTLAISGILFVGSLALVPFLDIAFLPDSSENIITVNVNARPGQTQNSVLAQAVDIENLLDDYEVESYQTIITGATDDFGAIGIILSGDDPNSATMTIELESGVSKQDAAEELRAQIAEEIPNSENISVSASGGGFASSGIVITLSAESPNGIIALPEFTQQVVDTVASQDDGANVSSNISARQVAIEVIVDNQRAAEAGLTPEQISASLSNLSASSTVTQIATPLGADPVRLIMSGGDAATIDELGAVEIAADVRLDEVATLSETTKQVSITRVDGQPASSVTADITSSNTGGVSTEIQSAVDKLDAPAGVEVHFGGVAGDITEGFQSMFIAIIISIVLVYGIMALPFGSWLDPFVILFTLPLAAIGALITLFATSTALSISALIGVLMLVGIVVTNAIVMLEFVIMLRKERGYSTYDALVEGAQTRLRPILMTAFAAMLALVPLSLGLTEGALIASDLGRTVIGGLFSSTLLTLLVVPVVYSLMDGLKERFGRGMQTVSAPTPPVDLLPAAETADSD